MLAAVAKRTKLTFFDDPYRSLASNSNKSKKKNIKKPTVSASVHSKLWMTMSWNARPFGERDAMFLPHFVLPVLKETAHSSLCTSNGGFLFYLFRGYLNELNDNDPTEKWCAEMHRS